MKIIVKQNEFETIMNTISSNIKDRKTRDKILNVKNSILNKPNYIFESENCKIKYVNECDFNIEIDVDVNLVMDVVSDIGFPLYNELVSMLTEYQKTKFMKKSKSMVSKGFKRIVVKYNLLKDILKLRFSK